VESGLSNWISISRVDPDIVWSIYYSSAKYSTDGGDSWTATSILNFPHGAATKIYAHPTNSQAALATFSSYHADYVGVAATFDMGASWVDVSGDLPEMPVNAVVIDASIPNDWYVGTDAGVWRSRDGGNTWLPYETGLPNVRVMDLEINTMSRKLVAGTYGRGAWEIDLPDPTAVEPWNPAALHLMLDQPFPNPASERTTLRFAAKDVGGASLDIYDVQGRRVDHVTEVRGDGIIRTLNWNPDELASGTYFAVLRAGDEKITRKLVVRR